MTTRPQSAGACGTTCYTGLLAGEVRGQIVAVERIKHIQRLFGFIRHRTVHKVFVGLMLFQLTSSLTGSTEGVQTLQLMVQFKQCEITVIPCACAAKIHSLQHPDQTSFFQ